MSAVYLLLLLLPLVSTQTFHWGGCPAPEVQPNFNLTQYLGRWYEIERLPASFERGKCIEANYALNEDGTIQVLNSQIEENGVDVAEGTAVVLNQTEPAKLGVKFSFFSPNGPYWVLSTDYTSYSVVYSCTSIFDIFYFDFAWILSRSRSLPPQTVAEAKGLMTRQNIELCKMMATDQTGCPDN
uniref:Apolipoprotein D n=1 Tax=Gasterosteus aculeatus aculeatus TaxID=481459 RepID=G3NP26_GASAC|nr:apolipoprotein D-like [Gasterosteus aculeatus aculeatus]